MQLLCKVKNTCTAKIPHWSFKSLYLKLLVATFGMVEKLFQCTFSVLSMYCRCIINGTALRFM